MDNYRDFDKKALPYCQTEFLKKSLNSQNLQYTVRIAVFFEFTISRFKQRCYNGMLNGILPDRHKYHDEAGDRKYNFVCVIRICTQGDLSDM